MTDPTFESRLGARLRRYTDTGVRPSDPVLIARTTIGSGRGRHAVAGFALPGFAYPRPEVAWVIALVALLAAAIIGAALVGSGSRPTSPLPTDRPLGIVAPTPLASATPSPSDGSCATDTARVMIGAAMPPQIGEPLRIGAGFVDHGAYLTNDGGPSELWSVTAGIGKRIAVIDGPGLPGRGGLDWVGVEDVSHDGSLILVHVGRISPSGAHTECVDLYLFRADGSTVERVTHNGAGAIAGSPARLSPDDRYIAFPDIRVAPQVPMGETHYGIAVSDRLAATLEPRITPCGGVSWAGYGPFPVAWGPADDALAAICGGELVLDVAGGRLSTPAAVAQGAISFGWTGPERLLLVSDGGPGAIVAQTFEVGGAGVSLDATASAPRRLSVPPDVATGSEPEPISPDGASVVVHTASASACCEAYVVRLADGHLTLITAASSQDASWSDDGRSVVFAQVDGTGSSELVVHDIASGKPSITRPLPAGYAGGVWRRSGS